MQLTLGGPQVVAHYLAQDLVVPKEIFRESVLNPNHVPTTLYENIQDNPIAQRFAGFFGSDGVNTISGDHTGFGLRATDSPFLFNLLKASGVKALKIRMGKLERVSSSYNAGHLGGVRWKYMGIAFPQARSKLGLLSSIIFNTDVQKATEFLFLLNLVGLLRFILLWVAGDGCLVVCPVFAESRETVLRLTSIAICARDDHILSLFKQSLSPYNLDVHCSGPSKNKAGMNTLHIRIGKGDNRIKNALMEGLQSLPTDLLHPKLALLKDLLKTQDNQLRLSHFPSRLPFHDYIQGDMDDKLLWVLGQDFHSLNVYSINAILRFAGLREITRIQDFDLKTFMRNALQVEAKTPKQQLFVDYINLCKSRAVRSGLPLNVQPNNFHFRCNLNDCKFFAHRKRDLQDHQKLHSKEKIKKYQCDFNGCSYSTDNKGNLQLHKKRHSKDRIKEFKCDVKDCPFKTDQKGNLQVHQRTHLPKDRIKKY